MALTAEQIAANLAALYAAYASAAKVVHLAFPNGTSRRVEYQSADDIWEAIQRFERMSAGRSSVAVAGFDRGDN